MGPLTEPGCHPRICRNICVYGSFRKEVSRFLRCRSRLRFIDCHRHRITASKTTRIYIVLCQMSTHDNTAGLRPARCYMKNIVIALLSAPKICKSKRLAPPAGFSAPLPCQHFRSLTVRHLTERLQQFSSSSFTPLH
ncbi:hypothetical protein FA13DRAFT_1405405 [Coprinellus micaceus]|uniref:Uncharacterized protein n=1 Tax=Coprinellus micaceus TaxID=71717 RepID=A0A4Y7SPM4_COPMI|nr:hypothetical protein FA13DRAFT_1405405 [Coprinellus micaceus]